MAAAEKSLWVQVMEAGFGATLEAHGFRKVSPRLYRLEGDGITWEQFTYRGSKENPSCLCEGHGAVIPGSVELYRKAFGDNPKEFGLRPLRHHQGGRYYDLVGTIESLHDWKEGEDNKARQPKTWLGKLWRTFRPDPYVQLYSKEPHYFKHFNADGGSWHLRELSVEELAARMSRYWVENVWEWQLSRELTFQDVVDRVYSDENAGGHHCLQNALYNHLAGRHEEARYYIFKLVRLGEMPIAEYRETFEASPPRALERYAEDDPERETRLLEICKSRKRWNEREAMQARRLAAAIDLEV